MPSKAISQSDSSDMEQQQQHELKIQKRLLTPFLTKRVPPLPSSDSERTVYPHRHTNVIFRLFFWWITPLMHVGYKRTIQPNDLYLLDHDSTIEEMYHRFMSYLEADIAKLKIKHGNSSSTKDEEFKIPVRFIVFNLYKTFWYEYTMGALEKACSDVASTCAPLIQRKLIIFVEKRKWGVESDVGKGIGYSIGCCLFVLFTGIAATHFYNHSMMVGAKCKAVMTKVILEKSFKLDAKGHHKYPAGKIYSLMSTDLNRVDLAVGFLPFLILFPIPISITIALLIVNIGVSALAGLGVFILCSGFIGSTVKPLMSLRSRANTYTDARVNLVKEMLKIFKMIKLYNWEDFYINKLIYNRHKEMRIIFKMQAIKNVLTSIGVSLATISSVVAFCVLWAIDPGRSVGDIFSALTLFQVLAQHFLLVPMSMAMTTDMLIGLRRVCAFLAQGEVDPHGTKFEPLINDSNLALKIEHADFHWERFDLEETREEESVYSNSTIKEEEEDKHLIHNYFSGLIDANFEVKKGEFIVITGPVGSGKTSLLEALAGFMPKDSGHLLVNGSLLLCGYPWVQNATVRENIIFGLEFNSEKYRTIVEACSLLSDFKQLPGGDMTEVGERGITLSGGQKARINLARAVYAGKDIILMDDVLSAVDAKVGKHIMDTCIMGYLSDKTRILATHQLSLIGSADRVIFLNGDGTLDIGTLQELRSRNYAFVKLMDYSQETTDDSKDSEGNTDTTKVENYNTLTDPRNIEKEVGLMQDEERAVNSIKMDVYRTYIRLGSGFFGSFFLPVFVMICILGTFCNLFTNNWLSFWTQHKFPKRGDHFYIGLYIMFAFLMVIFLAYEFYLIVYVANRSSEKLNILAAKRVLHAPMSYVDTTPIGRILNRFTKDTDVLDNEISEQLRMFILPLCNFIGIMILCVIYLPWFAIAVPILFAIYICVANFYQASSREIKRLEAIQRSNVFASFNETLGGMNTIKAYKAVSRFINVNDLFINKMNEAYYVTIANQRWLGINIDIIASIICLIIAFLCCFRVFNISASSTGLLMTYVLNLSVMVASLLKGITQAENQMNSVERLKYYAFELPQEAPYDILERDPDPNWPQEGEIKFENVSLRYRPELPYVLKNLSIDVKPNERIGICGRTGAGKSSLMTCLYRLSEPEGVITIDGVDIGKLGLRKLRTKLSIIPQDPVLFVGTIRSNLDPFGERTDEELWDALRKAHLLEESLLNEIKLQNKRNENMYKFHLDQLVEDDGTNFSLGERQLLALARALVRRSKILILDEATSSVDYETDSKIQQTIASEFTECTILCIAHRLKTILSYDRILVLDRGEISNFDSPWTLYNQEGIFREMCDQSNLSSEDFPRRI